ncbi:ATP-binding protein [Bordetella petrii]|uniref:ATP-binding protein n=1 Tax=Bordetella petrii TaxID=94624 RepID=UPI0002F22CDB|nr:ATP-binding protein [Bordetella petrii]
MATATDDQLAAMLAAQPWRGFLAWSSLLALAAGTLAVGAALLLVGRMHRQRRILRTMRSLLHTYMTMLDAIPMPIYLRNSKLELTACNRAYAHLCGQPRSALNLASVEATLRAMGANTLDARELERQYRLTMNSATPAIEDRTVRLRSGTATLQHWTSPLRGGGGKVIGVIGGWFDVTERHRALAELAGARDRAEAAYRAKSTFLASISHDIRTPMNAIMGMLELTLLQDSLAAAARQQLEMALQSARSLLALIDDLLDLSKMEAGKLDLRPSIVSLRDIAAEVSGVFSPMAHSKGVALDVDIMPMVADHHLVDPLRLKQILNNLLSNAIRFTEQGSIQIQIRATSIRDAHQWVQFAVSDTGIGIEPAVLPTLFDPFVQAGASATVGGAGLGLSICKRLVDIMGGYIRISSKRNQGTRVVVRLRFPVKALPQLSPGGQANAPEPQAPILVVDDHAANRTLLKHQLQKLGHAVVCAENGLQALEAVGRQVFKLAICDCAMPRMNGMEFVRALRAGPEPNARMPVLGYTAGAQDNYAQQAIDAGMDAVLFKPAGLAELQAALRAHLPQPVLS